VSQVMRRLRDHNIIQRKWIPGDRKDYYQAESDIFGNAFRNQISLTKQNLDLVGKYKAKLKTDNDPELEAFSERIEEMSQFYILMKDHFQRFQTEWIKTKMTLKE